jgi:hypothetical protein
VANANPGDTIAFALSPACSTITLTSGVIKIGENLSIDGPGADALAVSGNGNSAVLAVCWEARCPATVAISGLSIEDGDWDYGVYGPLPGGGGGAYNYGTLSINGCIFEADSAANNAEGGGIYNAGTMMVANSAFVDDSADETSAGGAIANEGNLTVTNSTFSGNNAPRGAALFNIGTLDVTNSTFTDNTSAGVDQGAGLFNSASAYIDASTFSDNVGNGISTAGGDADLTVVNTTVADNTSDGWTGGILASGRTSLVANSTIFGNNNNPGWCGQPACGGAGINFFGGKFATLTIVASIVAGNVGGDCVQSGSTTITDGGYNLEDDHSCGLTTANHDLPDTNPMLDPVGLADNNGPTETIALEPESPAIGFVTDSADCPATDQRGYGRTVPCDIGAYEANGAP